MDADITAATTQFDLEKIKAQDYRNALASQKADREAGRAIIQGFYDWAKTEYASLPSEEDPMIRFRRNMTLAIAVNYMKPSTATLDATILADADLDAKKLKAAVDAAAGV